MTDEPKPVVTQAALKHIRDADPGPNSGQSLAHDMARVAAQALASVVSQDLVEQLDGLFHKHAMSVCSGKRSFTERDLKQAITALIEAAQIAAVKAGIEAAADALDKERLFRAEQEERSKSAGRKQEARDFQSMKIAHGQSAAAIRALDPSDILKTVGGKEDV